MSQISVLSHPGLLNLSPQAMTIFNTLKAAQGKTISRTALYEALYGPDEDQINWRIIDVRLVELRRALKGSGYTLRNVRARGWALRSLVPLSIP